MDKPWNPTHFWEISCTGMDSVAQTSVRVKIYMEWDCTLAWKGSGRHQCLGNSFSAQRRWQELWVSEAGGTKAVILSCEQRCLRRRHGAGLKGMAWLWSETAAGGKGEELLANTSTPWYTESSVEFFHLNVHNWIQMFPSSLGQVHEGRNETRIFWIQVLECI